jgi:hypothetical protein
LIICARSSGLIQAYVIKFSVVFECILEDGNCYVELVPVNSVHTDHVLHVDRIIWTSFPLLTTPSRGSVLPGLGYPPQSTSISFASIVTQISSTYLRKITLNAYFTAHNNETRREYVRVVFHSVTYSHLTSRNCSVSCLYILWSWAYKVTFSWTLDGFIDTKRTLFFGKLEYVYAWTCFKCVKYQMSSRNISAKRETPRMGDRPAVLLAISSSAWIATTAYRQNVLLVSHALYLVCHGAYTAWISVVATTRHSWLVCRAAR